ncbi:MAG: inositol monophosphatase [Ilumatobacter sp.]|nr:inositol monophosphatase [Ilumatobacter sp.]
MPSALRRIAEDLARRAGGAALVGRRSLPVGQPPAHDTKSSATDPVTAFDEAAEATIVDALRRLRPDDAIVGEEGTTDGGTSGIAWHIDPIDGTANFLYDQPAWCTSIAAVDEHGSLAGAVYAPVADELFSAARGDGATLNGERVTVSSVDRLETALVGTGFSYLPERRSLQAERLRLLLPAVRDIRRLGSAALDLCYVACGRLDAYFEEHLNSWDLAAGVLIATEAGAVASDLEGDAVTGGAVLASSPGVHDLLLDAIRVASRGARP